MNLTAGRQGHEILLYGWLHLTKLAISLLTPIHF